jgi:LAGLIDADG DNA endonuclease family protein
MLDIATFLETSLKEVRVDSNHPQYRVRTINLASNIKLESYLDKYPLFSSKYLNYKDWLKILEFKKIAKYDSDFIDKVIEIKNGINNKRTIFGRRGSSTRILQGGALKKNKI